MKYLKQKDLKHRKKFFNQEIEKKINKFLFINLLNTKKIAEKKRSIVRQYFLIKKNRKTTKTKLLRRCLLTNRSRVSHQTFGISRIKLRELLKEQQIPGFNKDIW